MRRSGNDAGSGVAAASLLRGNCRGRRLRTVLGTASEILSRSRSWQATAPAAPAEPLEAADGLDEQERARLEGGEEGSKEGEEGAST